MDSESQILNEKIQKLEERLREANVTAADLEVGPVEGGEWAKGEQGRIVTCEEQGGRRRFVVRLVRGDESGGWHTPVKLGAPQFLVDAPLDIRMKAVPLLERAVARCIDQAEGGR